MSVIACSAWVRRGAAREHPEKVELSPEELQALIKDTASSLKNLEDGSGGEGEEDEEEEVEDSLAAAEEAAAHVAVSVDKNKSKGKKKDNNNEDDDDDLAMYNLDTYDDEDEDVTIGGLGNLAVFSSNKEDPYLNAGGEQDDDEVEDFTVQATDNLVIVGRTEEALSHLEIHVYNEKDSDFFQHHDILLTSFPLCTEWLDYDPGSDSPGNLVAVGLMSPQIEVWDVDVIDSVEPVLTLGDKKIKKQKKKKGEESSGHTKEVMGLSWNTLQRNVLASSSADCTVRIWDLATATSLRAFNIHKDKVQTVRWNPASAPVLLSGSFDCSVAVFDSRTPQAVAHFATGSAIETCLWDAYSPSRFFASCENGLVYCGDSRVPGKMAFTINAHNSPVSAMAMSAHAPGLLVTGASDQVIRVWDVLGAEPVFVTSYPVAEMTAVYTLGFSPELPYTVVAAGHRGGIRIIDLAEAGAVPRQFNTRLKTEPPEIHKELSSLNGPEREEQQEIDDEDDDEYVDDDDIVDSVEVAEPSDDSDVMDNMEQMSLDKSSSAAADAAKLKKKKKKKSKKTKVKSSKKD